MHAIETVAYTDGARATGVSPLPNRSPWQQERDHMCSLRRQLRFLQQRKPGHADSRKEIAALTWAIERLELLASAKTPNAGPGAGERGM